MRIACIWFERSAPVHKLAELFLRFSPQIAIISERAIFVEIGKCLKLYSEESFVARSHILLRRVQHSARISVGNTIPESLVMAKYNAQRTDALPLQALLDFVDPFMRDEAIRKSTNNLIESFRDLGINNLHQFKKMPVGELISRYGVIGRFAHQRVHQHDFINWPSWQPEEVIEERKDFPYFEFYGELDPILFELKTQLDRIFVRLFSRKRRLMKLQVKIFCEKLSVHPNFIRTLDFNFFAPQASVKGTLRILKERLAKEFEKNPVLSPIEGIQTTVLKTVPFEGGQKNIFNNDEEKSEQLFSIHNQLIEMLGKENVYQVELTEDRRLERSWKKKFDSPHDLQSEKEFQMSEQLPERLTYICRVPIKVDITAGYVHINKKKYRILQWQSDIEKIKGGWYETRQSDIKDSHDRAYNIVVVEKNQKLSIFQTPSREYYLHSYSA